jgi:hypothetical protein
VAQAHDYWEHLFLKTAGLPVTRFTVWFLSAWAGNERGHGCDHNPIQLSQPEPGSTRCRKLPNGRYSRNYTDTQSAANAFADQLTLTDYPHLRKALASGNPWTYQPASGVSLGLQEWGSLAFQAVFEMDESLTSGGGSPSSKPGSKNVGGAWTHLMKTLARDGHRTIVELRKTTATLNRIERRLRRA